VVRLPGRGPTQQEELRSEVLSAEATFWAWMMGVKPSSCKIVLLCLGDCHNPDSGRCDPSNAYICAFTGLDRKTVIVALQALEKMGLLLMEKRSGKSPMYHLLMNENPVPTRQKGERKKPVSVKRMSRFDLSQFREGSDDDLSQNRAIPKSGYPETGTPEIGIAGYPKIGTPPIPISGHEPTKNLQVEPTSSDTNKFVSAAGAANPVDNSLQVIGDEYQSPSAASLIFIRGVKFLTGYHGLTEQRARACLARWIRDKGEGRTLDAVIVALLSQPAADPIAFVEGVLARQPHKITTSWQPDAPVVAELEALNIPARLIQDARDIFVVWFSSMEILHSDWPRLFHDWVLRDWERAEFQHFEYRRRLASTAGLNFQRPFKEPA
jgi:hypothetical protein